VFAQEPAAVKEGSRLKSERLGTKSQEARLFLQRNLCAALGNRDRRQMGEGRCVFGLVDMTEPGVWYAP
jgi:hypothetical protein